MLIKFLKIGVWLFNYYFRRDCRYNLILTILSFNTKVFKSPGFTPPPPSVKKTNKNLLPKFYTNTYIYIYICNIIKNISVICYFNYFVADFKFWQIVQTILLENRHALQLSNKFAALSICSKIHSSWLFGRRW